MEVKPGYKQTEVGMIPIDWEEKSMDELTSLMTNGFVGTATNEYSDSDDSVLYIQGYNVKENGFDFNGIKRVNKNFHDRHMKSCLRSGDLLTIQTGDIGVTTMVTPDLAGSNCHALVISRFNVRFSDPLFYCYYFNSEVGRKKLKEIETGSTMKHLNVGDMKQIHVVAPPLREQTAIATALYGVDALVDSLDRLISKKRDLKQATMQQLLTGQTRLPGFSGEWLRTELKHLVRTPITDGPHLTPTFYETGVPFLSVNNLTNNRIDLTDLRFISKADDEIFSRKCKPQKGDVLLGKAASVGKVAIVEDDLDFNIWSPIALVRSGEKLDAKFLYFQLLSADSITQVTLLTNSSSQGNIGMGDIEKIQISYPCVDEQIAISKVLTSMDMEISALESRRNKTGALKQGMMQELLTGRTRLV